MTFGGLKTTSSPLALVAAAGFLMGGLALTPAVAADLGGDCCADLEERVSELEATTARKGNCKVSLTISGHVSRVMGWYEDEYGDSEWYSTGNGTSGSRLQFSGTAALTNKWTAGYTIRYRFDNDRDKSALGRAGTSGGHGRQPSAIDRNFVFLKNDRLGTFVLGQAAGPTGGIASISLGGHGVVADSDGNDWNGSSINGFNMEQDISHQAIAWISPTIRGFTFAIAWADLNIGSNSGAFGAGTGSSSAPDAWDMALRYAQEFGPIRVAAGIGYTVADDNNVTGGLKLGSNLMGSVALMHTPTGLNVSFAAGTEIDGGLPAGTTANGRLGNSGTRAYSQFGQNANDAQFWYVSGGINRDFTGHGNTSFYGEYGYYDYNSTNTATGCVDSFTFATPCIGLVDDTVEMWGLGVVQHFDKAATELFIAYRHWDQTVDNSAGGGAAGTKQANTDGDVDQLRMGMRIKF